MQQRSLPSSPHRSPRKRIMSFASGLPAETSRSVRVSDEELRARRTLRQTVNKTNASLPRRPDRCGAGRGGAADEFRASCGGFGLPFRFRGLYPAGKRPMTPSTRCAQLRRRMLAARGYDGEGIVRTPIPSMEGRSRPRSSNSSPSRASPICGSISTSPASRHPGRAA